MNDCRLPKHLRQLIITELYNAMTERKGTREWGLERMLFVVMIWENGDCISDTISKLRDDKTLVLHIADAD